MPNFEFDYEYKLPVYGSATTNADNLVEAFDAAEEYVKNLVEEDALDVLITNVKEIKI